MRNRSMESAYLSGLALDVSGCKREGDAYVLTQPPVDGHDYCDVKTERWIWSIGRRLKDGVILAALDGRFYQNEEYECLWLR